MWRVLLGWAAETEPRARVCVWYYCTGAIRFGNRASAWLAFGLALITALPDADRRTPPLCPLIQFRCLASATGLTARPVMVAVLVHSTRMNTAMRRGSLRWRPSFSVHERCCPRLFIASATQPLASSFDVVTYFFFRLTLFFPTPNKASIACESLMRSSNYFFL